MRRLVLVLLLIAAGVAAALGASAYASDQEFERLIAAGDRAMAAEQPAAAIEAYSGAIALKADAMLGYLKRGQAYLARSEWQRALRDLDQATRLDATAPLPLELLGDANEALGRHDRAIRSYEARLGLDDRSASVQYRLGLARYRAGDVSGALRPVRQAIVLDKDRAEAHYLLGLCLRDTGEASAARDAFERASKLAPGLTAPRDALAALYEARGDSRRALDELGALVTLEPGRPERLVALALATARAGRRDAAHQILARLVERFPDSAQGYAAIGHLWLEDAERGDRAALARAVEALTDAAAHPDADGAALTDLGRAAMLSGDNDAAERALRQAIAHLPVPPVAYRYLSALAARKQQWTAARDHLVRYATLAGDREPLPGVAEEIGALSERIGDTATAARWRK